LILRRAPFAALLLLLVGCSSPKPTTGAAKRPAGSALPAALLSDNQPATFSGTFAGTENWTQGWTLCLRPDSTYFLREEHVHGPAGGDHTVDDIGRWEQATDGGPLRLAGGRVRSMELEVRHPDTLRLPVIDPAAGDAPRDLIRMTTAKSFEPSLTLVGRFRHMADAANFDECLAGLHLPVLMEGDYLAAERAYGASGVEPGAPLLMTVQGRIVLRPGPDGGRPQLLIEQFVRAMPGENCPTRDD